MEQQMATIGLNYAESQLLLYTAGMQALLD